MSRPAALVEAFDEAPPHDCPRCPRLAAFREQHRAAHPDWHNAPVPSFGDDDPRLLIVGLAPGLRGANRTGRPFTGDYAGVLLYETLLKHGFAHGAFHRLSNGLLLADSYHCSRYNTNTGKLTPDMFDAVFAELRRRLAEER